MPDHAPIPPPTLASIRQVVREELAPLRQELTAGRARRAQGDLKLLLSLSGAERLLGIRHGAISSLLKSGQIRTVPWLGRVKISRAEVERLAREGLTPTGRRPRTRRVRGRGTCDPEALRRLRIEDL